MEGLFPRSMLIVRQNSLRKAGGFLVTLILRVSKRLDPRETRPYCELSDSGEVLCGEQNGARNRVSSLARWETKSTFAWGYLGRGDNHADQ